MFESMGLQYAGPIDGHNVKRVTEALDWARKQNVPTVVHTLTTKGKGYGFSEQSPEQYHGVSTFDHMSGINGDNGASYSTVFGDELLKIAKDNGSICAITASMTTGTGLSEFARHFPGRFFDTGIAEGHAAVMAAGMASQGVTPVFAVYSTFLQRSYDMLIHDIAISGHHVVIAVDRAGLVSGDGETHQGIYDVAFLTSIPGMTVLCPASYAELRDMLRYAIDDIKGPVALRYPRGAEGLYKEGGTDNAKLLVEGSDFTLISYGETVNTALEAVSILLSDGISAEVIKLGCINPLDEKLIAQSVAKTKNLLVIEECSMQGSIGERIGACLASSGITLHKCILLNTGNAFIPCGEVDDLRRAYGLDAKNVCETIRRELNIAYKV